MQRGVRIDMQCGMQGGVRSDMRCGMLRGAPSDISSANSLLMSG